MTTVVFKNIFITLCRYEGFRKYLLKRLYEYYHYLSSVKHKSNKERNKFADMKKLIRKDDVVIIDGGANKGTYTVLFKIYFPKATIHCFEPQTNIPLRENVKNIKDVYINNVALGDKTGKIDFNISEGTETSTILYRGDIKYDKKVLIDITTLDDWFEQTKQKRDIDIIKLDLEGYDYKALQGAKKLLDKVKIVYLETLFAKDIFWIGSSTFCETKKLLEEYDFEFFNLYDKNESKEGVLRGGNALFVKKNLLKGEI